MSIHLSVVTLLVPFFIVAQQYEKQEFVSEKGPLPYRILLPENYKASKNYPLLVFLHGSGERGKDNELQLMHGSSLFLQKETRKSFPAIVVFPQCPKDSYWAAVLSQKPFKYAQSKPLNNQLDLVEEWLTHLETNYPVRANQIYLAGLSMGGMGTLELLFRNPQKFAAAIAICGGVHPSWAEEIQHTPLWLIHGQQDQVVAHSFSEKLFNALQKKDAPVRFTSYPELSHNSWDKAFQEPDFLAWLFSHQRN